MHRLCPRSLVHFSVYQVADLEKGRGRGRRGRGSGSGRPMPDAAAEVTSSGRLLGLCGGEAIGIG